MDIQNNLNTDIVLIDNIQDIVSFKEDMDFKISKGYSLNIKDVGIVNSMEQLNLVYKTLQAVNNAPVKMGKPSKRNNTYIKNEVINYYLQGKTQFEIVDIMGISRTTVYKILKEYKQNTNTN